MRRCLIELRNAAPGGSRFTTVTMGTCLAMLCLILTTAGCESRSAPSGMTQPSPPFRDPPVQPSLSGQVFEVTLGGSVPASNIPVHVAVRVPVPNGFTMHRETTTTDPDGRYHFPQLPAGFAAISPTSSATHRQVCGAAAELRGATRLDLEITPIANPQPSPTMPSLKVSGLVYETTPAGRVGVGGAVIYLEWLNDAPFLYVFADKDGHYTACGIPANWPIAFWPLMWHQGFHDPYTWHRFSADTTLDIELTRR